MERGSLRAESWPAGPVQILATRPPYQHFDHLPLIGPAVAQATVLVFRLRSGGPPHPGLWSLVRDVRRSAPASLLAICLDDTATPPASIAATGARAIRFGVRAMLVGEPTVAGLRDALRVSRVQPQDVAVWLKARLGAAGPEELGVCDSLGRLVAQAGLADRERDALPRVLGRLGLPTFHKWTMLAKALPCVVTLQCGEAASVEEALLTDSSGYRSRRSLDRACVSLTGLTARRLGRFLGWEVVLERMLGPKLSDSTS